MKSIDVLYTANSKYIDFMLASICSLLENSGFDNINLHIITLDFSIDDYKRVERIINNQCKIGFNITFYPIDNSEFVNSGLNDWRGSQIANARLFISRILRNNIDKMDKLLYLDADTIVVDKLLKLDDYKDYGVMAVKDHLKKSSYQELSGNIEHYYNSGVLLINIKKWQDEDFEKRIADFIKLNTKKLYFPDQDALNCSLYDVISGLPQEYNVTPYEYIFNDIQKKIFYGKNIDITLEEAERAKSEAKILHCIGLTGVRPWTENNINPFNEQYLKYIYKINPDFKKHEIGMLIKIFILQPQLFYYMQAVKPYLPTKADKMIRMVLKKYSNK